MPIQQQYTTSLGELVGRVRAIKPNLPPTVAQDFVNDRIRLILDRQPCWSGNFEETILYIPPIYNTGTISFTQNSRTITGSGTVWPVSDVVNTTISAGVLRPGFQTVTPASMSGITADSYLYVDAGGTPEIVSVIYVGPTSFTAIFESAHSAGCTVTSSSFAGRQLRCGNTFPIFTIEAVVSSTQAILDMQWKASAQASVGYTIRQMYYTVAPDVKMLSAVVDQAQGIPPLRIDVPITEINRIDPQRVSTGYPQILANRGTNANGNMQWEIWPSPQEERQLRVFYFKQPPKLTTEGDRIPAFMNPTVLFYGAMADAFRIKIGPDDAFYDPRASRDYEQKFEAAYLDMAQADNEKLQQQFVTRGAGSGMPGGADWNRSHSIDALMYSSY